MGNGDDGAITEDRRAKSGLQERVGLDVDGGLFAQESNANQLHVQDGIYNRE